MWVGIWEALGSGSGTSLMAIVVKVVAGVVDAGTGGGVVRCSVLSPGAESRDEALRVWRGGASEQSLDSPSSRRRRWLQVRFVDDEGWLLESSRCCGGNGVHPGG